MSSKVWVKCPKCGEEGRADKPDAKSGIECPSCGVQFVPERVKSEPLFPYWAWVVAFVVFLVGMGLVSFWVAVALAGVALLGVIAWQLWVIAHKRG